MVVTALTFTTLRVQRKEGEKERFHEIITRLNEKSKAKVKVKKNMYGKTGWIVIV
jgi:hypothetical protein